MTFHGLSRDEQRFLDIVKQGVHIGDEGSITMPLPFKKDNVFIPENRIPVYNRTKNALDLLKKQPEKLSECIERMKDSINAGHVEQLDGVEVTQFKKGRAWWLPIFPVTHPRKKKSRLV